MNVIQMVNKTPNGIRLAAAAGMGIFVAALLKDTQMTSIHWMGAWLAFSVTHLFFSWVTICTCKVHDIRKLSKKQDSGRALLTLFMLVSAIISLVAIVLLYSTAERTKGVGMVVHVLLTMASIGTAWAMVHTTLVFKYAHLFYSGGGLDFPGEEHPDYMDFVYFSFVIGTTFQVSDVSITSSRIRRVVWLHGMLSFMFNTVIVALTINIVSSLIQND